MQGLTPREIIAQLDAEEIDREILNLEEEIAALRALRKVAMAKNGKAPATGNRGSSKGMREKLESAAQVLKKWGPLDVSKLAERAGCRANNAHWFLKALGKDSRFSLDGETVSLATADE